MEDVKSKTEQAIASGQSLEEFITLKPTAEYDETRGQGFLSPEYFLTIVYQSLAQ